MSEPAFSKSEMMIVAAARALEGQRVCFVGVGLPNIACNLARHIVAPGMELIYESGVYGARPERLPLSIGDPTLVSGATSVVSMADLFGLYLQRGLVEIALLGGAQVDRYGNLNSTVIGAYNISKAADLQLVRNLASTDPARLHRPIPLQDVLHGIVPYRTNRRALQLDTSEDYEMVLLRLCAGEGSLVRTEPEAARARFAQEVQSPNPDLHVLYSFENVQVTFRAEQLKWALELFGIDGMAVHRAHVLLLLVAVHHGHGDLAGARTLLERAREEIDQLADPGVLVSLLEQSRRMLGSAPRRRIEGATPLTDRELTVLRLLPTRLSTTEIGHELHVSVNTVRSQVQAVYRKLEVTSRAEAVARARHLRLLPGSTPTDRQSSHPDEPQAR